MINQQARVHLWWLRIRHRLAEDRGEVVQGLAWAAALAVAAVVIVGLIQTWGQGKVTALP